MKKRIGLGTWSWGNKLFWNYKTSNDENLRETFNEAVKSGFVSFSVLDYSLNSENFINDVTEFIDV